MYMGLSYRGRKLFTGARFVCYFVTAMFLVGCAQVPQSSVTLSNSIGEDIVSMKAAHKQFVDYYYDNLEAQANELIDSRYRPQLLRRVIEQDVATYKSPETTDKSLFNAIHVAFVDNESIDVRELDDAQSDALEGIKRLYIAIDKKVEVERRKLLDPLRSQRSRLLERMDKNYANMIQKNSAVTALLNSVVRIHQTQHRLFEMVGVEQDVRANAAALIKDVADVVGGAQEGVDDAASLVDGMEEAIENLGAELERNPETEE